MTTKISSGSDQSSECLTVGECDGAEGFQIHECSLRLLILRHANLNFYNAAPCPSGPPF
eukprot:m.155076 g.155076  ORF g.155076 m.155076 type:complete len:59 (+) comp14393_c0_seq1:916-1092(+)